MKLRLLILIICCMINSFMLVQVKNKATEVPASAGDGIFKNIIKYIYSFAEDSMKSSDLLKKKKIAGALPEGYPAQTRKLALKTRDDMDKWKRIIDIPTELYRTCLYSNSNVNYYKWCNNNFFGSKSKRDSKRNKIKLLLNLNYFIYIYLINSFFLFLIYLLIYRLSLQFLPGLL